MFRAIAFSMPFSAVVTLAVFLAAGSVLGDGASDASVADFPQIVGTSVAGHGSRRCADLLFDFESEDERAKVPEGVECVRGAGATSGEWCIRFSPQSWRRGLDEKPGFSLDAPIADWSKYDRLVVDVSSYGNAARVKLGVGSMEGGVLRGISSEETAIPEQGFVRWVIPFGKWPKGAANVQKLEVFLRRPVGVDVRFDRFILLKRGEAEPEMPLEFLRSQVERTIVARLKGMNCHDMKDEIANLLRRAGELRDYDSYKRLLGEVSAIPSAQRHIDAMRRFKGACITAGQSGEVFVGKATAMEKIRPRGVDVPKPADRISVSLARGECESAQVFAFSDVRDLHGVRVAVSDLKAEDGAVFSATNAKMSVLGYVETKRVMPYYATARPVPCATNSVGSVCELFDEEPGWWPDPILEHLDKVDVQKGDLQGFWLRFRAPRDARPGVYRGEVSVAEEGRVLRRIPIDVRVYGFEIPVAPPIPMLITFYPERHVKCEAPEQCPDTVWKRQEGEWYRFLADYFITIDDLYHRGEPEFPHFGTLKRLAGEGRLRVFNLGCWDAPKSLSDEDKDKWRRNVLARIKKSWEDAKAAGLEKYACIYGCDEVPEKFFPLVAWAAGELKREIPGVPLLTTAFDSSLGVGSALKDIDWFTPSTSVFDVDKAAKSRAEGHKVWWYICCLPPPPCANMFIECAAIEGRVLMGAQTAKFRPDGFLYYQTAIWNSLRPISGPSAFTDWEPISWTDYHGDGSWTCCGPDGIPLPTVRLENFRDGLEDLAYVKALEAKIAASPKAQWAEEAKALVAVPAELVESAEVFTRDPARVCRWRNRMAELIELE